MALPDLTTTVLTVTVTGLGADTRARWTARFQIWSTPDRDCGDVPRRRLIGAALVLHVRIVLPLAIALGIAVFVALESYVAGRSDREWTRV